MFLFTAFPSFADDFPIGVMTNDDMSPDVVYGDTNYLVVWMGRPVDYYGIYGQRVSLSGSLVGSVFPISSVQAHQEFPAVAAGDSNYLVVWWNWNGDDIYGQLVSFLGTLIGNAIPISVANLFQWYPDVCFGDTNYLVVWMDRRAQGFDIYGQIVSQSGNLVGSNFPISSAPSDQQFPAIAWDGTNYLVVWMDSRNGDYDIYGQRVSPSGNLIGDNFSISTATDVQVFPAIAWDGANYLVVWQDRRNGTEDIYGQRVSPSGNLIGDNFSISTAANEQVLPDVAWDGTNYLVVWQDKRNGTEDIYGQLVSPSGSLVGNNFPISEATDIQGRSAIAWGETKYLVVWEDKRNGTNSDIWGNIDFPVGIEVAPRGRNLPKTPKLEITPTISDGNVSISYIIPGIEDNSNRSLPFNLKVYDKSGGLVKTISDGTLNGNARSYTIVWDGTDEKGKKVNAGTYFVRLQTQKVALIRKLTLVR